MQLANPIYRVPIIGPWARRIGQIEDIMSEDCSTTPEMWIEGFFVNIPKLIYTFVEPDCLDIVFARLGNPHHKRRKLRFTFEGILEAEENNIPVPGYGKWLFRLAKLTQRFGFWMMVIDASLEFGVNWTSTVYQYAGCRIPGSRWMKCDTHSIQMNPFFNPQRFLWGANLEGDGQLLAPGGTGVTEYNGMNVGISISIKTKEWTLAGPPVGTLRVYILDSHGRIQADTGDIKPNPLGKGEGSTFVRLAPTAFTSTEYQVWCECSGGWVDVTGSTIAIVDNPNAAFKPSQPCGYNLG